MIEYKRQCPSGGVCRNKCSGRMLVDTANIAILWMVSSDSLVRCHWSNQRDVLLSAGLGAGGSVAGITDTDSTADAVPTLI